jgi:hypothetical protein
MSQRSDLDRLVDAAMGALGSLARRGSTLTTGVALIALVVVGLAYAIGIAALDGSAQSAWVLLGGILLVSAVGAPLLASMRLRAIPKSTTKLATELRGLLGQSDEARQVVIETVAHDEPASDGRPLPAIVYQSQHFTTLRTLAGTSEDFKDLAVVFHRVATLPGLVAIGLLLTALGALCGFVLFLVLIF